MSIEIKVPALPESVTDALLLDWRKQTGESVARDEILVEIETDKIVLEITAPSAGQITEILQDGGAIVTAGQVLAKFAAGDAPAVAASTTTPTATPPVAQPPTEKITPVNATPPALPQSQPNAESDSHPLNPAARQLIAKHGLDVEKIPPSGAGGRITKEDVLKFVESQVDPERNMPAAATQPADAPQPAATQPADMPQPTTSTGRSESRAPMSRLRRTIADRLVKSQHDAALLTTFNEVNMQEVTDLRNRYKEDFEKNHSVRLGLMSFFVKASVVALQKYPTVNSHIDGDDIVTCNYQDIGIAVASERGLVVPILRNCADLRFKDIEKQIREFGERANQGKIGLDELSGGTFTITNGGVFGSLLSTPIVNPPQSAILGMHKIQPRPVAEDDKVVVRPMMYLALSYDHRLIDGVDAVGFLVAVKEVLENPEQLLLHL